MLSRLINGLSDVASKVVEFVTPKQGQKVGFVTDTAAVVATAVAAAIDPIFAFQLAGTYMLGRHLHNVGVEQDNALKFTFAPVAPRIASAVLPRAASSNVAVRLIDDEHVKTPLQMLYEVPGLTDEERMQIAQTYV
jgi:hypothetical protein